MKKSPLLLLAMALAFSTSAAAQHKINVPDLARELQKQSQGADSSLTMVWWIPAEFWQASMAGNPAVSEEGAERMVSVLKPYLIVAVVDGKVGPLGGMTFTSEQTLRSQVKVVDAKGSTYLPLADEQVSTDVKNLVQIIRPMFANNMGPLGENFRLFIFPARDSAGAEIANPIAAGELEVRLGEQKFHWRLPLGSLLPPKVCPDDGEVLNGAWTYCPWHGTKLRPQATPATSR